MASENIDDSKDLERKKLLEEIRQRAEEAELRRIEREEGKTAQYIHRPASVKDSPPREGQRPAEHGKEKQPAGATLNEERLIDLRGQFTLAIHRKDLDLATDLFIELSELIPGTLELASFDRKLQELRRGKEGSRGASRAPETDTDWEEKQRTREKQIKKIAALLERSLFLYEQEKYDQALAVVQDILTMDEKHEEALELRAKIEKAKDLANQVLAEEARRKAEEAAAYRPAEKLEEPPDEQQGDVWGGKSIPSGDVEYGLQEEDGLAQAPGVPIWQRLVHLASGIRIPVKPLLVTFGLLGSVALGYLAVDRLQAPPENDTYSLLILPAWHAPSDSMAEYLSYALTEQVVHHIAAIPDLRVIAAPTAASLRYARGGPAAAARSLNVRNYLHWNIKTTPASVSFDLTLRDTGSVEPLWSSQKESSIRELPAAVMEIVRLVTEKMDLPEAATAMINPAEQGSRNPDAYLSYLYGRFRLFHPTRLDPGEAIPAFRQAIQSDPGFTSARVALAAALLLEYEASTGVQAGLLGEAMSQLREASSSGSSGWEELRTLALVEQFSSRYEKAVEYLQKVEKRAPGDAETQRRLARLFLIRGNPDEALTHARRAERMDPLNVASYNELSIVHNYRREFDAALRACRKGASLASERDQYVINEFPELLVSLQQHDSAGAILADHVARSRENYVAYYRLGRVHQAAGKPLAVWEETFTRAKDLLVRRLSSDPRDATAHAYLALVYTRLGRYSEAGEAVAAALRHGKNDPGVLYLVARTYAMQKDQDKAMENLRKALDLKYDLSAILDMDFFNLTLDNSFLASISR